MTVRYFQKGAIVLAVDDSEPGAEQQMQDWLNAGYSEIEPAPAHSQAGGVQTWYLSNGQQNVIHIGPDADEWLAQGFTAYPDQASMPQILPPPPRSISKVRLKYALGDRWPAVRDAIAADPALAEDWALASEIYRDSPLVQGAAAQLGIAPEEMDAIFRAGAALEI